MMMDDDGPMGVEHGLNGTPYAGQLPRDEELESEENAGPLETMHTIQLPAVAGVTMNGESGAFINGPGGRLRR